MLEGKVAIVTGSSAGIGAAVALELSSRGACVVINYPFPHLKDEAAAICKQLSTAGIAVEADLSTIPGPQSLIDAAVKQFGKIDILVNNASVALFSPLESCTLDQWDTMVNLNARGYFVMTQATLPHLNNPSRIINITSSDCRFPSPTHSIYAGTKGFQDVLTKVWAMELPPKYGCTVNAVVPGPTRWASFSVPSLMYRTPALEGLLSDPNNYGYDTIQQMMTQIPCGGRLVEPDEVAYAVGMLCEDRARFMNGLHVHVNGGLFID